jgi:Tfp pilus assembly protein PilF
MTTARLRKKEAIEMPIKPRTLAWLLASVWIVAVATVAEGEGRLLGKVLGPDGKGLEGVVVTATSPEIPGFKDVETTDKRGLFTIDFPKLDTTYHYRFDKAGFQSMEVNQEWRANDSVYYEWTMHPGESAPLPGAIPAASTSQDAILAYNAGVKASRANDNAAAAAKFKEAVGHDPKLRQAWESLAVAELSLGQNQDAVAAAEKAIALGSTDKATLEARWQAYRNLKEDAKAELALKDMQKVGQATEEAKKVHNEGVALMKAGDYAGAFAKFQEALKIDPNLQPSLLGLAEAGLKSGHNAEAETAAETVLKTDPKNEQAIRVRYNAALALGDKAKLSDALVGLAAIEPAIARNGLLKLAFDAYDANDMAGARAGFEKVLEVDPNYPLAHYYLGVIEVGQGATAEAKAHLERFVQLAPNDAEAKSAREMLKELNKP